MTGQGRRRAAIFDLDGVLADTSVLHEIAWERLAAAEGFAIDPEVVPLLKGRSREASLELLLGDRQVDPAIFQRMLDDKNATYRQLLSELRPGDAIPGSRECLAELARHGWMLAVGSSSRNAAEALERLELDAMFETVVDGNAVAAAKPDPAVFVEAARRLDVGPADCVVIEDAAAGIEAARRAAMATVGVGERDQLPAADVVVRSVAEIDATALEALVDGRGRA